MGKESENKAGRILSIFTRLKQGKVINKQEESNRYEVAERTIQRDITDMQCFLQEQASVSGEIQEIVYDKKKGGYILQTRKLLEVSGTLEKTQKSRNGFEYERKRKCRIYAACGVLQTSNYDKR